MDVRLERCAGGYNRDRDVRYTGNGGVNSGMGRVGGIEYLFAGALFQVSQKERFGSHDRSP